MRICLLSESFPAPDSHVGKLASGLVSTGHDVTVLCAENGKFPSGAMSAIKVVVAEEKNSKADAEILRTRLPQGWQYVQRQRVFWTPLADLLKQGQYDIVEAPMSLGGTLVSAFTREVATVLRIENVDEVSDELFELRFAQIIRDTALSCTDALSCSEPALEAQYAGLNANNFSACVQTIEDTNAAEVAAGSLALYERAIEQFQEIDKPNLYRHGSVAMARSLENMLLAYEKMLYDLLYRVSYRFRLLHWLKAFSSNPEAFFRKLTVRLAGRG